MTKSRLLKLERKYLEPAIEKSTLENIGTSDVIVIDSLAKIMVVYSDEPGIKSDARILLDNKFRKQFVECFAEYYSQETLDELGIIKQKTDD